MSGPATSKANPASFRAEIRKALLFSAALIGTSASASGILFSDYAATPYTGKPASVHINTKEAHEYRTELKSAASEGVNFAGHYTLVQIGAGSGTVLVAVVDSISGKVYFPKKPGLVTWADWWNDPSGLVFQRDSNLLAVYGRSGSEEAPSGLSYFLWRGKDFKLLTFEPRDPGRPPE